MHKESFRAFVAAAAAACAVMTPRPAAAETAIAVLGVEAAEGVPDQVTTALTDALRQRVSATKGFRLVPGRDLIEVKLVFSCPDEAPSCMAQAAKSLGANKLLFGGVKKGPGDGFVVTLKMLDAAKGQVESWTAEQVSRAQATGPGLRGPVQKWFAALTGQAAALSILRIRANVPGASVALDGSAAGVLGGDDLVLSGLAPGRHEVMVHKPGYEPFKREVTLSSGETEELDVKLVSTERPSDAPIAGAGDTGARADVVTRVEASSEGSGNGGIRSAAWGVLGAGLLGIGLGVKFSYDVLQTNRDLDPFRRFPCVPAMPGKVCNITNGPAEHLDATEKEEVEALKKQGKRFQMLQWVGYGAGGALLITSGYLFYKGYFDDDDSLAMAGGRRSRLRLLPVLDPAAPGLAAFATF